MKRVFPMWVTALAVAAASASRAQVEVERVPDETAQKAAARVGELVSRMFADAPLRITGDAEKAAAFRGEGMATLLVPERGFTAKSLEEAGAKAGPAGWIALRGLAPVVQGKIVPPGQLASVRPDDKGQEVFILFLGVRKEGEKRVLEVFSREAKPLLQAPLTRRGAADVAARPLTVRFANLDRALKQVDCIVVLAGAYEATLRLGAPG